MRVYLAIRYHADQGNRHRIEGISKVLERQGIATCCIVRDLERWGTIRFTPQDLMQHSFREVDNSDIVLVDLTEKGVGVGIEAGYAYARKIPVITIAQTGSAISTTIRGISHEIVFYNHYEDLFKLTDLMRTLVNKPP